MIRIRNPLVFLGLLSLSHGFSAVSHPTARSTPLHMSSYSIDGSEYSSSKSDYDNDDEDIDGNSRYDNMIQEDDTPTVELQPVPMSKNSGNRFVALVWDRELGDESKDCLDLHDCQLWLSRSQSTFH